MDPQSNEQPKNEIYAPRGERHLEPIEPMETPAPLPKFPVDPAPISAAPVVGLPNVVPSQMAYAPSQSLPASQDLIADDVDVIEKEWVQVAEQVVRDTAGDPHAEEEAVENLQVDYMKKRYGKDIKKS